MNHLHKLKKSSFLKWGSSISPKTHLEPLYFLKNPTFYTSFVPNTEKDHIFKKETVSRTPRYDTSRVEAQSALLEYLHGTQNLPFPDAEHISKNCPSVIDKLLEKVECEEEIKRALTRHFRYNPINEFEAFFESIGLRYSELGSILPQDLMFLKDDPFLLENYHALCNYGVPHNVIGKFYKEAMEVFRYDVGVLQSKLQAYEGLGLSHSSIIKVVVSSPSLLIGGVNEDFVRMLDLLKSLGIEFKWIEWSLSEKNSYNWSHMLGFLSFLGKLGYSSEELGTLLKRHPGYQGLLLEGSGEKAFHLVGLLVKMGSTREEISSLLLQLPRVQIETFMKNVRQCLLFFRQIEMDAEDIRNIVRAHPLMLGSCTLKKTKSILVGLNVGKKRLCSIIKENPCQLKNWILGLKVQPVPDSGDDKRSLLQRREFLLNLGFKDSDELERAFKLCRGKGGELQERFDCFLNAGLDRKDVIQMIKVAPQILNITKDSIEQKIDFLVNESGYPISSLLAYPLYTCCAIERVKIRFSMYTWLKNEGIANPKLALSTIMACSDGAFTRTYVNRHPRGPEVWENLKKEYSG